MSIYIPFTYLIGWSSLNIYYYGRRTAKNCHPNDLWKTYFTSSKYVKEFYKTHGEPDIIEIRKTFPNNPFFCILWESKVLDRMDVQHDVRFLNKKNGYHTWDTRGMVPVKDSSGKTFSVSINDPRYLSGELIHVSTGVKQSELSKEKRKETVLMRYGFDHIFKDKSMIKSITEKSKKTKKEKYNSENYNNREKSKQTSLLKYGVDVPLKCDLIKNKTKQTNLEKYGFESHNSSQEIKEKKKLVFIEKYGVESFLQTQEIKTKREQYMIKTHGVSHYSKIMKTCDFCGKYKSIQHQHNCPLNPNKNIKKEIFTCPNCNKQIVGSGNLKQHLKGSKCKK